MRIRGPEVEQGPPSRTRSTAEGRPALPSAAVLLLFLLSLTDVDPAWAKTDPTPEHPSTPHSTASIVDSSTPTPAFSRMYGTACSTCHTAAPKLNVLGEAFRLNGYRLPANQSLVRRDDPVALGAPEWDEAWPRAIRSSELPGLPPLAVRIMSDAQVTRDERLPYETTYRFPNEVHLLASAPLDDDLSVHVEGAWDRTHGLELHQARIELQDVVPGLPERALDVKVGLQHLYLLTLMDRHLDLAGRQGLLWQSFDPSEIEIRRATDPRALSSPNRLSLLEPQPAVEINGLVGGRFFYAAGLSQGLQEGATDANGRKDLYYKVRYKLGGLDFAGRYDPGEEPEVTMPGQLLDRGFVIEHFGYFGGEGTEAAPQGNHRALGAGLRAFLGRSDLGVGYVLRTFQRPWPELVTGRLRGASLFARGEYLVLPWVVASLKAERFTVSVRNLPPGADAGPAPSASTRLMPGVVLLLRQNVRLVLEGELFTRAPSTDAVGLRRPHGLWMRLDVAF